VRAIRFRAVLIVALLALAGCGGGGGSKTAEKAAPPTQTAAANQKKKSPESQPGGAGDEKPIATQALFTAKGGRVSPRRIRVPPFIAVSVVLRSVDEKPYTLLVGQKEIAVGEGRTDATLKLDGLRPGAKYIVRPQFGVRPKRIVIVANAEPGP
jgi:hypothetical protein